MRKVDNEYSTIRDAIKARDTRYDFSYMLDYLALERLSYKSANTDIRESFTTSQTLGAIKPPIVQIDTGEWVIDKDSRFFTDDIHYGLCIAKWIAEKMGVSVPNIDNIICWAQELRDERILDVKNRRLLEGANVVTTSMLGTPSVYGLKSIDDIMS